MRPRSSRRSDRMRSVAPEAGGASSKRTAPEMLAVRCAQRSIAPTDTSARSKGALWARARRALTAWPNAPTDGARTQRSQPVPEKKEAKQTAKGRSPPPPARHREGATAPSLPISSLPEAATAVGAMEVEELALPQGGNSRMAEWGPRGQTVLFLLSS